jgi:CRP-like cAMP-binding protein
MLEEHGIIKKYSQGEMVFEQGNKAKEMYIIRCGKVKIYRQTKEGEVVFANLGPDEFFGEMAFFGNQTRSASAKALEDSELLVVDRETMMKFIKEPVIWSVLERMSQRIREVDDKIEDLLVKDMMRKEHLKSIISRRRLV